MTMDDESQITAHIVLVRPHFFGPNAETSASNFFQQTPTKSAKDIRTLAVTEFDRLVQALVTAGAKPIVFEDTDSPIKPDAIFPNNWASFHADGTVFLYPMESPGRRAERRTDIVESLSDEKGFRVREIIDLSPSEDRGIFLEGTGSMVLDRPHRVAYAALSSRTHMTALADFAQHASYEICAFEAVDSNGGVIYHTNVMMNIGERFAVICAAAIIDTEKREAVLARLAATGREVIEISVAQMESFAGNILELATASDSSIIVMSQSAHVAMSNRQLESLARYGHILPIPIDTIERVGGGSVRCMMAEIFLPRSSVPVGNKHE
jgi:hypothetical protein